MTLRGVKAALPKGARRLPVPAAALGPWLAEIHDPAELKVTLRTVALLAEGISRGGTPPSVAVEDLLDDNFLAQGIASGAAVRAGLAGALRRGTLIAARAGGQASIFLNDDAARRYCAQARLKPLSAEDIAPNRPDSAASAVESDGAGRANIYALYEQHIGTFGPSRAAELQAAEEEYPARWIEYAFAAAAEHNARSWSYVASILRRLVRDGLPGGSIPSNDDGKPGIDSAANRRAEYLEQHRRLFGRLPWEPRDGESGDGVSGGDAG